MCKELATVLKRRKVGFFFFFLYKANNEDFKTLTKNTFDVPPFISEGGA
jgi:hypothetical protein